MAHKKGLGSSRNGREWNPKMLGVKVFAGQKVSGCSEIMVLAHSGSSIQIGIFSRLPPGSKTQTAPSPRAGLRRICRVARWSG